MSEDAMLRRVRALLELAKSPNENEAAAAAAKAQELMALHNLDLSRSGTDAKRGEARFKGGLYKWQRDLWEQIARLHFCMYWCEKGTAKGSKFEHRLLGREVNTASAAVLGEYLEEAINRLTRDKFGAHPSRYFSKEANAYREGITSTLTYRLWTKREQMKAEEEAKRNVAPCGDTTNALTITLTSLEEEEQWANNDAMNEYEPGYTKALRLKQRALYAAQVAAAKAADELLQMSDPAQWQAKTEAARKADEERRARWAKEDARRAKRPRKVKPIPEAYWQGVSDGNSISLDQQIDKEERRGLIHNNS